jgi:hypothetical protein
MPDTAQINVVRNGHLQPMDTFDVRLIDLDGLMGIDDASA